MSQLTDRLERDLREVAAGAHPSPSAWELIAAQLGDDKESEDTLVLVPTPNKSKRPARIAAAAAALVVIIGSIAMLLTRAGDDQSISTDPDETVVDFPNLTTTFVSPRNGFSIKYPDGVAVTPAEQLWAFQKQVDDGFDVVETGSAAVFKAASAKLGQFGGVPTEEGIDDLLSDVLPGSCGVPRSQQAEITIERYSGRVAECANHIEATVVLGGRLYLFTLSHDRSDARAVFDAFVATIDLIPETAVDFPGLTTTFVSPTYGYSFGYHRGLTPATERWDPDDQPVEVIGRDPRFDAVETGLEAQLQGASTPIPDGISIDAWVDEHVTTAIRRPLVAGGCRVPRSQQAEITIDGQSGRIAECQDQVEATVVAGGRLYLFILYRSSRDARAMFDSWNATIDLTPKTAAVP